METQTVEFYCWSPECAGLYAGMSFAELSACAALIRAQAESEGIALVGDLHALLADWLVELDRAAADQAAVASMARRRNQPGQGRKLLPPEERRLKVSVTLPAPILERLDAALGATFGATRSALVEQALDRLLTGSPPSLERTGEPAAPPPCLTVADVVAGQPWPYPDLLTSPAIPDAIGYAVAGGGALRQKDGRWTYYGP